MPTLILYLALLMCFAHILSVPKDFASRVNKYSAEGLRMIGFAFKHVDNLSLESAQQAGRELLESNLVFAGLLLFENKLKPTSVRCVREIQAAGMRCSLITGDHVFTAVAVARQCGILSPGPVYLCTLTKDGSITWVNSDDPKSPPKVCLA